MFGQLDPWFDSLDIHPDGGIDSSYELFHDITLVTPDLVSIHFDYYDYVCCRPYPNLGQRSLIVDLADGRLLDFGDIVDLNRLEDFQALWFDALEAEIELDAREFVPLDRRAFSALSLHPNGLEVGTDRGAIAGAALGPTRTLLPFDELGDLVNPDLVARARLGSVVTASPEVQ